MHLQLATKKYKGRAISFEGWFSKNFGVLSDCIEETITHAIKLSLQSENTSVNFAQDLKYTDSKTPATIHLSLPFGTIQNYGPPTLEFTLAELIDDALSWSEDCGLDDLSYVDDHEAIRDELRRQADRLDKHISERRTALADSGIPERK